MNLDPSPPSAESQPGVNFQVNRPVLDFHTHIGGRLAAAESAEPDRLVETLLQAGLERFVVSAYAPQPAQARLLNRRAASIARRHPQAVAFGTFHPLDDVEGLAREAFGELGLAGFEIHCQAQACYPDDPGLTPAFRAAERLRKICLVHSAREPQPSPYEDVRRLERVLRRYPGLTVVAAHLGGSEFERYFDLAAVFDNLYLDTALVFTGLHPWSPRVSALIELQDRVVYGSAFPDIPYHPLTGVEGLLALELGPSIEDKLLYANAARLLGLGPARRRRPTS